MNYLELRAGKEATYESVPLSLHLISQGRLILVLTSNLGFSLWFLGDADVLTLLGGGILASFSSV